jgi:hypothetical protein
VIPSCVPCDRELTRAVHANLNFLVTTFQLTSSGGKAFELGCAVFERLINLHLVRGGLRTSACCSGCAPRAHALEGCAALDRALSCF